MFDTQVAASGVDSFATEVTPLVNDRMQHFMRVRVAKQRPKASGGLGFRDGTVSVHTSRTMMLPELTLVLDKVPATAASDAYTAAIVLDNALGKPTQTTRVRTAQRLAELYALDPTCPLFRLLRHFWAADAASRPMLALLAAAARDPVLREVTPFVVALPVGELVTSGRVANALGEQYPKRFGASTALATAQRLAASWGQAGYLSGKFTKTRSRPVVTPVVATFALLLGYLSGLRGRLLLDTPWTRLLGTSPAQAGDLAVEASRQGWLTYKVAGAVVEVTFPGLLKPQEEEATLDPN